MARIQAYLANFTGSGGTNTVVTGPGGIHTIIATASSTTAATLYLYDNTAGSGTVLIALYMTAYSPFIWNSKDIGPIRFVTGLTVVCPTGVTCFVVTEQ